MGVVREAGELAAMLLAQERLGFVMDVAAGTGNLKRAASRSHTRDLERLARGAARRRGQAPLTRSAANDAAPGASTADLAAVGIAVVVSDQKAGEGWPTVEASDG